MPADTDLGALDSQALDQLVEELELALVEEEPDPNALCKHLTAKLEIPRDEAEKIFRDVVWTLNRITFPPIKHLELLLTEECNLRCSYCFERNMRRGRKMTLDVALAASELFLQYASDVDHASVTFFGGEPLLAADVLEQTAAFIRERGQKSRAAIHLSATTNGTIMTQSLARMLKRYGVFVTVSIDGLEQTHNSARLDSSGQGTFQKAIASLDILRTTQSALGVKMTTLPRNVPCLLDDVVALYERYGVRRFLLGHATGMNWTVEAATDYFSQLKRVRHWRASIKDPDLKISGDCDTRPHKPYFGCRAGRVAIAVRPDGSIGGCSRILGASDAEVRHGLGHVRYGLYCFRRRLDFVTAHKLEENCHRLNINRAYAGGCYGLNVEESGNMFFPSAEDQLFANTQRFALAVEPQA